MGWNVDTIAMVVSCPPERKEWIKEILAMESKKITTKLILSITGVLEFLAAVLPFLRAPLGWLRKRKVAQERGSERCDESFLTRFRTYLRYLIATLNGWKWATSIEASLVCNEADAIIVSDASGDVGFGMLELKKKLFGMGKWSQKEISAMRDKAVSSTHLEVVAICRAIVSLAPPNSHVKLICDSQAAVFIMEKRYDRSSEITQGIIITLDKHCRDNGISVYFVHTLRDDPWIQIADDLSKGKVRIALSKSWKEEKIKNIIPTQF